MPCLEKKDRKIDHQRLFSLVHEKGTKTHNKKMKVCTLDDLP